MKTLFLGKQFFQNLSSNKELSNGVFSAIYTGNTSPSYNKFVCGGPRGHFVLEIFSGEEFDSGSTSLIKFEVNKFDEHSHESGGKVKIYDGMELTLGVSTHGAIAEQNGIATWFSYYNVRNPGIRIDGTVGLVGTEADLIVADTTIIKDKQYKSFGFKLLFGNKIFLVGT